MLRHSTTRLATAATLLIVAHVSISGVVPTGLASAAEAAGFDAALTETRDRGEIFYSGSIARQLAELDRALDPHGAVWSTSVFTSPSQDLITVQQPPSSGRGGFDFRRRSSDEGRGGDSRGGDSRGGPPSISRSSSSSSSSSSRTTSAPLQPLRFNVVTTLPAAFAPFDRDGDNQIGLYEWDRAHLSEFLALDRNGDGFLTPNELTNAPAPTARPPAALPQSQFGMTTPTTFGSPAVVPNGPASAASGSGATTPTQPGSATPATPTPAGTSPAAASPTAEPSSDDSPEAKRAKYFFSLTDKNKDGMITENEWAASRGVPAMFTRGGVTPTLPMTEAAFVTSFLSIGK